MNAPGFGGPGGPGAQNTLLGQAVSILGGASSYLKFPAIASTGIAVGLTSLLYFKQKHHARAEATASGRWWTINSMLIYPSNIPEDSRTHVALPNPAHVGSFEDLTLETPDGERIRAYYMHPQTVHVQQSGHGGRDDCTIIMFHGNAGNIGHRLPLARKMMETTGCSLLMVEYRGYGYSTGSPSESGLMIDAQTSLDWLRRRWDKEHANTSDGSDGKHGAPSPYEATADEKQAWSSGTKLTHAPPTQQAVRDPMGQRRRKIYVFGQSLGGAVATRLVADNQHHGDIGGLVLENTFLSMRKMIPSVIPPARYLAWLCHQRWSTEDVIPKIKLPVLFLSGLLDEIVPPSHMRQLYELCTSKFKRWKTFPGGCHNATILEHGYFEAWAEFVKEVGALPDVTVLGAGAAVSDENMQTGNNKKEL